MINASMMGKSRLIKQIAAEIPTIYISLRENDDGYPPRSSKVLSGYLTSPPYSSTESLEANETAIELYLLTLFCGLFEKIYEWCQAYDSSQENDRKRLMERLWYDLAEDEKASSRGDRETFWSSVITGVGAE